MLKPNHTMTWIITVLLCAILTSPAQAELAFDIGIGYMWGNTTMESGNIPWGHGTAYYMDGNDNPTTVYPRTRIEFPLDVYLSSIKVAYRNDNWLAKALLAKDVNDPRSKAKDEEYAVAYWDSTEGEGQWYYITVNGATVPDVEQKLDVEIDALMFDVSCLYKLYSYQARSSFECFFGMGYAQRDFDYSGEVRDVTTADYIGEWTYTQTGSPSIDYTVKYSIPYLALELSGQTENISAGFNFGYSPFVKAKDSQDNYLGRIAGPYSADGDCDGYAYMAGLNIRYDLTPHWSINALFDYLTIRTNGEQTTTCFAGEAAAGTGHELSWTDDVWENDEKLTSEQYRFLLSTGYRF